jgi:hypothetical protein
MSYKFCKGSSGMAQGENNGVYGGDDTFIRKCLDRQDNLFSFDWLPQPPSSSPHYLLVGGGLSTSLDGHSRGIGSKASSFANDARLDNRPRNDSYASWHKETIFAGDRVHASSSSTSGGSKHGVDTHMVVLHHGFQV